MTLAPLLPTAFHREIHAALVAEEPGLVKWYSSDEFEQQRAARLRLELLRSSYRLSAEAHERPYRIARAAAAAVGVEVPITLYQLHHGNGANAGMFFAKGEAHLVLSGPLLSALDDAELAALFGHELAHHKLFTDESGKYHASAELLEAIAVDGRSTAAFVESAARHRRWTEIYADRGAAISAGAIEPAIACLVKVGTGLAQVSVADYLAQAREVVEKLAEEDEIERGSHPENAVRAVALEIWRDRGVEADAEIAKLVEGVVDLEALDLVQQRRATEVVRAVVDLVLDPAWMRTDANLAHARMYFGDYEWAPAGSVAIPAGLEEMFAYVLLDFAVVDRALGDVALARGAVVATQLEIRDAFAAVVKKELKTSNAALDKLEEKAPALFEKAAQAEATE